MGTVTIRNVHARNDPSWSCSIDGIEHTAVNNNLMDTNRWILCTNTSVLASGVHTATINVTSLGTPFYFDYLHYLPAPSVSENSQIIAIDSLNPIIQYDSDWTNAPNGGGHVKQKTGGTLSIQFNGGYTVSSSACSARRLIHELACRHIDILDWFCTPIFPKSAIKGTLCP